MKIGLVLGVREVKVKARCPLGPSGAARPTPKVTRWAWWTESGCTLPSLCSSVRVFVPSPLCTYKGNAAGSLTAGTGEGFAPFLYNGPTLNLRLHSGFQTALHTTRDAVASVGPASLHAHLLFSNHSPNR